MAVHVFSCPKCRATVEIQRSIKDDTLPLCCEESCGGIEMERVIPMTSFSLKGSGWAKDGYGK